MFLYEMAIALNRNFQFNSQCRPEDHGTRKNKVLCEFSGMAQLPEYAKRNLERQGLKTPLLVQKYGIPLAMLGYDVVGKYMHVHVS